MYRRHAWGIGVRWQPPIVAALATVLVAGLVAIPGAGQAAARSVIEARVGPMGFGVGYEQEAPAGASWLAGITLQPAGFYGGLRRYLSTTTHRPFLSGYLGIRGSSADGYRLDRPGVGIWLTMGYEVRPDPQVRLTGEIGMAAVGVGDRMEAYPVLGLGMGLRL